MAISSRTRLPPTATQARTIRTSAAVVTNAAGRATATTSASGARSWASARRTDPAVRASTGGRKKRSVGESTSEASARSRPSPDTPASIAMIVAARNGMAASQKRGRPGTSKNETTKSPAAKPSEESTAEAWKISPRAAGSGSCRKPRRVRLSHPLSCIAAMAKITGPHRSVPFAPGAG